MLFRFFLIIAVAWSLHSETLMAQEWPDELPASLLEAVGAGTLRDTITPQIPDDVRLDARKYAEESVERIKEHVFPTHSL